MRRLPRELRELCKAASEIARDRHPAHELPLVGCFAFVHIFIPVLMSKQPARRKDTLRTAARALLLLALGAKKASLKTDAELLPLFEAFFEPNRETMDALLRKLAHEDVPLADDKPLRSPLDRTSTAIDSVFDFWQSNAERLQLETDALVMV